MTQVKAIFNNGQTGSLPAVAVTRNTVKDNIIGGGTYPINSPSYGHQAARCRFNNWTETVTTASLSWNLPSSGFDSDGITPLACAVRAANSLLCIWRDSDIDGSAADGGSAVLEINLLRASSQTLDGESAGGSFIIDIMNGASVGEGDVLHSESTVALQPKACIVLPGCFIFICRRMRNTSGIIWSTEGIGLVAMQRGRENNFTRKWLGDLQTDYLADPFVNGWRRGREWMAGSYWPFTLRQLPPLRVFIPFVDYINDTDQGTALKGGQVGIIEATRPNEFTNWAFGTIYKIFEKEEDGNHFHTAAWTPRGVVLSMGDSPNLNENILFTCSDWDDYTNASNWTTVRKAYGSGEFGGSLPEHGHANPWAGAVPSLTDINKFLVGGDGSPAAVFEVEVLADNTLTYTQLWGYLTGDTNRQWVALDIHGSGERQTGVLARSQLNVGTALVTPLIYGNDDVSFASIAKMPSTCAPGSILRRHGTDAYALNLGGSRGVYKMPLPGIVANRGLAVGPGGINLLELNGSEYFLTFALQSTVLTYVSDSTAPSSNPVLEVEQPGGGANQQLFLIDLAGSTYAFSAPVMHLVFWFKNLLNTGIPLRIIYDDQGAGGNGVYSGGEYTPGLNVWQLCVMSMANPATPWANPHEGRIRFEHHTSHVGPSHFRLQIQGAYEGPECPYLIAPQVTSTDEEVEQSLGTLGPIWTVGIELHIPMCGADFHYSTHATPFQNTITLATVYIDANNYVEIIADLANDEIDFHVIVAGSELGASPKVVTTVALQRDTTILLGVTFDGTNLEFFAACGGLDETGLQSDSIVGDIGSSVAASVRIGAADFAEVPNTEVNMIAVDDSLALSESQFLDMMADSSAANAAVRGSGYAAMSHANLVIPKII